MQVDAANCTNPNSKEVADEANEETRRELMAIKRGVFRPLDEQAVVEMVGSSVEKEIEASFSPDKEKNPKVKRVSSNCLIIKLSCNEVIFRS